METQGKIGIWMFHFGKGVETLFQFNVTEKATFEIEPKHSDATAYETFVEIDWSSTLTIYSALARRPRSG